MSISKSTEVLLSVILCHKWVNFIFSLDKQFCIPMCISTESSVIFTVNTAVFKGLLTPTTHYQINSNREEFGVIERHYEHQSLKLTQILASLSHRQESRWSEGLNTLTKGLSDHFV